MRLILALLASLVLAACASVQRYDAGADVHALLIAIRDGDKATFDRHVDREALKRQIQARLAEESRRRGAAGLGAFLAPALASFAGDVLVQPQVFRLIAEQQGYRPGQPIPNALVIGNALRPAGEGRVCAPSKKNGPCALVFTRQDGVWRLTGFEGDLSSLKIG